MGSQTLLLDSGRLVEYGRNLHNFEEEISELLPKKNSENTSRRTTPICTISARTSLYIILNLQSKRQMKTENFSFLLN